MRPALITTVFCFSYKIWQFK